MTVHPNTFPRRKPAKDRGKARPRTYPDHIIIYWLFVGRSFLWGETTGDEVAFRKDHLPAWGILVFKRI